MGMSLVVVKGTHNSMLHIEVVSSVPRIRILSFGVEIKFIHMHVHMDLQRDIETMCEPAFHVGIDQSLAE